MFSVVGGGKWETHIAEGGRGRNRRVGKADLQAREEQLKVVEAAREAPGLKDTCIDSTLPLLIDSTGMRLSCMHAC